MTKKIIFQSTFAVAGIMCHQGCGNTIHSLLNDLEPFKQKKLLPQDAQLIIDAEPQTLGIHRLIITIESENFDFILPAGKIYAQFKENLEASEIFKVLDDSFNNHSESTKKTNWYNILANLISILTIISLAFIFPPSVPLTMGLTTISLLTTLFTARHYLIDFAYNLRQQNLANMTTTISLGWFLSSAHLFYHSWIMPLANSFSMIFMNFIMPITLIMIINSMDEIKRVVLHNSRKMHLQGIKTLFPLMAKKYSSYQLSDLEIKIMEDFFHQADQGSNELPILIHSLLNHENLSQHKKNVLKKGMIISVKAGECFPVDCKLIQGNTLIDASLLTGEPQQRKKFGNFIPAGAVNLGHTVLVYALADSYNSTVNQLLFRSNRAQNHIKTEKSSHFTYFYMTLIILGMAASFLIPISLGLLTIPLLLQNLTGILLAICPCTIAIAHQLPSLLSLYQRSRQGIFLRRETLHQSQTEIHTVVFDKTGTLTTGNSQVESCEGINPSLWQRIYLLEKHYGENHPLAKAICHYYEEKISHPSLFQDLKEVTFDAKNRGLSAFVQGKKIALGNLNYFSDCAIMIPPELSSAANNKLAQGYTPVYVAEDNIYQGVIYIRHEIRKEILVALTRLKDEGKTLIVLTGDTSLSAHGFNQQHGNLFNSENIHAQKTPADKENFLINLMDTPGINPQGVWFIGDGLNDAPCARITTERGGISCTITPDDKASYFTDISLNGSLDYLFAQNKLNQFLHKNIKQNQGLLIYSAIIFLIFIITFSSVGIAVSPLISMSIMTTTTLYILLNSYRLKLFVDKVLEKKTSWTEQWLASDLSLILLMSANTLFAGALLISTVAAGSLTFPTLIFSGGSLALIATSCVFVAASLIIFLFLLSGAYLLTKYCVKSISKDSVEKDDYSDIVTVENPYPNQNLGPRFATLTFKFLPPNVKKDLPSQNNISSSLP